MSRVTEVIQFSQLLQYKAELDMAEWLMMITGTQNETLQGLGTKIAFALQKVIYILYYYTLLYTRLFSHVTSELIVYCLELALCFLDLGDSCIILLARGR